MLNKDEINTGFETIWKRKFPESSITDDPTTHDLCRLFYTVGYGNGGVKALETSLTDRIDFSKRVSADIGSLLK